MVGITIWCQDGTTKFKNFYVDGEVDEMQGYEDVMLGYEHAPKTFEST